MTCRNGCCIERTRISKADTKGQQAGHIGLSWTARLDPSMTRKCGYCTERTQTATKTHKKGQLRLPRSPTAAQAAHHSSLNTHKQTDPGSSLELRPGWGGYALKRAPFKAVPFPPCQCRLRREVLVCTLPSSLAALLSLQNMEIKSVVSHFVPPTETQDQFAECRAEVRRVLLVEVHDDMLHR